MSKQKTIYFAHPFDTMGSEGEKKIIEILTERGYDVKNPFEEGENELNEKYGVTTYYDKPSKKFAKEIVEKDEELVRKCDELFAWIPKGSTPIGTIFEISWAFELFKQITVLCYKPQPFFSYYSNILYISYKDFVENKPYVWMDTREITIKKWLNQYKSFRDIQ